MYFLPDQRQNSNYYCNNILEGAKIKPRDEVTELQMIFFKVAGDGSVMMNDVFTGESQMSSLHFPL